MRHHKQPKFQPCLEVTLLNLALDIQWNSERY